MVKPFRPKITINRLGDIVCKEFEVKKEALRKPGYNNIARQTILCLAVNYGGMTLKETGQKYGARSYFCVCKAVSRFRQRLAKNHTLNRKFKNILSTVQM